MSYYYVKSGGTATGDGGRTTTLRTGTWNTTTSEYYDNINDALSATTPPVSGDIIQCSSSHDYTHPSTENLAIAVPAGVTVNSVDDSDQGISLSGAKESAGTGRAIAPSTIGSLLSSLHIGMYYHSDTEPDLSSGGTVSYDGCTLSMAATSSRFRVYITGSSAVLKNTTLAFPASSSSYIYLDSGDVIFDNVTFTGGIITGAYLFRAIVTEIYNASLKNTDFTSRCNVDDPFIQMNITPATYVFERCKINTNQVIVVSPLSHVLQNVDLYSCDIGDGYHYFEFLRYEGTIKESTIIYRTAGATYDGSNHFSAEFQPNSNVVPFTQPLKYKLGEYELDLTSINTLTFHIAMGDSAVITPSSITNDKYWIEIVQNDTTDNALGVSSDTKSATITTTASALANAAAAWTGMSGYTYTEEFQIPIDTTVVAGMTNGQVTAYLCVAESIATREVFACPKPEIT